MIKLKSECRPHYLLFLRQDVLTRAEKIYEESGAKKVKQRIDHLSEDAREAWETSQNPWVYRISSVYDTLTAETPESVAVRELRKLDPEFTLDDWRQDVVEHTLPKIMDWFLQGKINQLKPWLGEGVFKRIAAEITARQQEGVQIDTHVLGIMNSEILACEVSDWFQNKRNEKVNLFQDYLIFPDFDDCNAARRSKQRIANHYSSFYGAADQLRTKEKGW